MAKDKSVDQLLGEFFSLERKSGTKARNLEKDGKLYIDSKNKRDVDWYEEDSDYDKDNV